MTQTVEAIVWCPVCKKEKYTVYRVQTANPDVYTHRADPAFAKLCNYCGTILERKE